MKRPGAPGRAACSSGLEAFYIGAASDTASPAHHALQICIVLSGQLRLRPVLKESGYDIAGHHWRASSCDGIIASGHEGGFHTAWEPVHSTALLPAVAEAFPDIPVVGAGGFCDGKTLAAALVLRGVGIQMGTRFLCTQESDFGGFWKHRILNAGDRGTQVARSLVGPARFIKSRS